MPDDIRQDEFKQGGHTAWRIAKIGLWEPKIEWLLGLYDDISRAANRCTIERKEVVQHA